MNAWLFALPLLANAPVYDAESTLRKLAASYPHISIARAEVPASVRVHKRVEYARRGDRTLALDLYLPAPSANKPPLVVLVHGGGWRSGDRSTLAPLAARLAARGIAAATVSYRLSGEAPYPAAIHDVKESLAWLAARQAEYGFDGSRIAVAGGSAGGQIAALVGMTDRTVRAVVNIDGLSDFTSPEALKHEDDPNKNPSAAGAWFGGRYAEKRELWHEASPINHVGKDSPPVLFIVSGEARFSVGREAMAAKLALHGVYSTVTALPGTPHSFWLFDPWLTPTVDAMEDFLQRAFGNRYRNPILHADYSDPDVIRVGDTYYMTSSSFANSPGLPLLVSQDMVNWSLVGHALPQAIPGSATTPQHGGGVWAPCLRYHDGKFWIFYPDPDRGIYVMTAKEFNGPWSAPHLLLPGKGIIDPTPLWDDDGKAWLLHAWAKSRAGINNVLTLRQMAPDGRSLLDSEGKVVIDGHRLPGYRTLEGPKLYKHDGWYYVFAPAGGVEHGWQSVFRSRRIDGPYEDRIVMEQGATAINGPHQGAWVRTPQGSDWFYHFQDKGPYGRIVHLQPMQWKDGWPLIGASSAKPGVGQPVTGYLMPVQGKSRLTAPPTSDEFDGQKLGLQWQWTGNWDARWFAFDAGALRLFAQPSLPVRQLSSVLTQKLPAPAFSATAKGVLHARTDGDQFGLGIIGTTNHWIGVRRIAGQDRVVRADCKKDGTCDEVLGPPVLPGGVQLRVDVAEGARVAFSYSADGSRFVPIGQAVSLSAGRWVGAQLGLFATGQRGAYADIDFVRFVP